MKVGIVLTLSLSLLLLPSLTKAALTITSSVDTEITLTGYCGIETIPIFHGAVNPRPLPIHHQYTGLALVQASDGRSYPLLLDKSSCTFHLPTPDQQPTFIGCRSNRYFHEALQGKTGNTENHPFVNLLLGAKQSLDSSSSIKTLTDLQRKRNEFYALAASQYDSLKNSDLIRRLISRSFMMHEYVDYSSSIPGHIDIKTLYEQEIMANVSGWLECLKTHMATSELMNFIVNIYYKRSMVTLASKISERFNRYAYCQGEKIEENNIVFPESFRKSVTRSDKITHTPSSGDIIVSFVSLDCPVSLVATIKRVRMWAEHNSQQTMIVVPLEKLNDSHLAMGSMLSEGNMVFIDDEDWRHTNLPDKLKLPLFISLQTESLHP